MRQLSRQGTGNRNKMSRQSRPNCLHFVIPDFQNGGEDDAGHENSPMTSVSRVITEHQRDINTNSAIQIAQRLAIIGDELNHIYRWNFQNRLDGSQCLPATCFRYFEKCYEMVYATCEEQFESEDCGIRRRMGFYPCSQ
ncbi:hypothetical protein NDU88_005897 [Pleurodeles waltl]|uniref:Uncharacterized protein n=1 Tax=Pleurodeles waltl TaxID=8319 RepID=A0AAV7SMX9_PLEWA|nr:hypothetical protein NDU88_005897 [Pleurodeles waltl]